MSFRIGLVFVVSDEDDIDGMQDAGVALVRAFNYISDEVDSQSAFDAVISVSPFFTNTPEEVVLLKTLENDKFDTSYFCPYDNCYLIFCVFSSLPSLNPPRCSTRYLLVDF